jgi:hypothetical protein
MAAKEMYDYLPTIAADYNYTLNIKSHQILAEEGSKNQEILRGDDGSEVIVSHSTVSEFYVTLIWNWLSESDAGIIVDLWHDPAKANGMARSYKWYSYADRHTYVVKNRSQLTRNRVPGTYHTISSLRLKVIGKIVD